MDGTIKGGHGENGIFASIPGKGQDKKSPEEQFDSDEIYELLFGAAGVDKFSEDGISAYQELVAALDERLGSAVTFDKKTDKGQLLFFISQK